MVSFGIVIWNKPYVCLYSYILVPAYILFEKLKSEKYFVIKLV